MTYRLFCSDNINVMNILAGNKIKVDLIYADMMYEDLNFDWINPCHALLKETGSIFIQTDYRSVAELKIYLDNLFGKSNFQNWIIWPYDWGGRSKSIEIDKWCLDNGYAWEEDIKRTEEDGCIPGADPSKVSDRAIKRGIGQIGTLGSGNHYLEIQLAKKENIFDEKTAQALGITKPDQVCVMIHCGSRGFGHQIASDYLKTFLAAMPKYNIKILDRELACAPYNSPEGKDYFAAMACAANMAFVNRQVIMHRVRECFSEIFNKSAKDLEMNLVYDVAHNIAKIEEHNIDGKNKNVLMHRKGATRCFGPKRMNHPVFSKTGQPVIVGGSMETGSFLLVGTDSSEVSFCSTAHGSGRTMSRSQAKKQIRGDVLQKRMLEKGIYVKSASFSGLAEEAGFAYKDINEVVDVMDKAGISKKVALLIPIGNIKG